MSKPDDEPPTKRDTPLAIGRATKRTVLGFDETVRLLDRLGRRPGILADRLRAELEALMTIFGRWPDEPPSASDRIEATKRLSTLIEAVHGLDAPREEPPDDPPGIA